MEYLSVHEDIAVQPRVDLGILIVRWLNDTSPDDVKTIYLSILDICVELSLEKVLIDLRRREHHSSEVAVWFFAEYINIICGKLDKGLRISYLVAPDTMVAIREENNNYDKLTCKISVFDTEQGAVGWLAE